MFYEDDILLPIDTRGVRTEIDTHFLDEILWKISIILRIFKGNGETNFHLI